MTLLSIYQQFLRSPNTSVLADNAALYYIPTLTTISESTAILKHLQAQGRQLTKKSEKALDAIEGANALYLDTETTIEFLSGGGAYLPGLDDNFLAERTVTLPLSYVVHFDEQQKISQIRVYWDQGSLLRQLEVIGARGRNWPIRDGKDQVKLIASNTSAPVEDPSTASSRRTTVSDESSRGRSRSHASSLTSATGDRQNLSLFAPRQQDDGAFSPPSDKFSTPRGSARPVARDLADILGSGEEEAPSPASTIRSASPKKNGTNQRAGASKHYHAVRLFEDEEERPRSPEKGVVPKQYQHFEFGAGEDVLPEDTAAVAASAAKQKKHASQWDFEDFMTPNKAPPKLRPQDQRTFGWSDDEDEKSPVRRPVVHQPRPDAKAHFEFVDDGTPAAERKVTATKLHNQSLGLYKDHVVGDDDADDATLFKKPLATVTNINNQDRHRDFGSSWEMRDDSPSAKAGAEGSKENHPNNNQKKVLNGLNANWGIYDESPDGPSKENHRAIKSANNGPGGRKRQEERHWGNFAEDYAEEAPARPTSKARPAEKSFWDF